jgi:branched-chain amino acid transport system ATP-binding protein
MALAVTRLSKAYGGVEAVRDVSFDVAAGEMVALIGPNGAGKTTCFNILNGQLSPDAGDVRLDGTSLLGLPPHRIWRLGVGRTFQVTATFASMSVRENVQAALLSHQPAQLFDVDAGRGFSSSRRPTPCSSASACASRPRARARSWPMAT